MKLVPVTFPLSTTTLTPRRAHRARVRENGPIRITLRAIEATPRADARAATNQELPAAPTALGLPSRVSPAKKKTSAASDVLLMLL